MNYSIWLIVSYLFQLCSSLGLPKERRQTTAGATVLYSNPASGSSTEGLPATDWEKKTATFTATSTKIILTVLVRNDPSYFSFDDFLLTAPSGTTNLVQNGGFETGSLSPWVFVGVAGLPAGGAISSSAEFVHSGTYGYADGAVGGVDGVSQAITTTPGVTYTLTFWVKEKSTVNAGRFALAQVLESDFKPPTNLALTTSCGTVTPFTNPTIKGNAAPRQGIKIFLNGALAGSTISQQDGTFTFQFTTTRLNPGSNTIEATAVVGDLESDRSDPLIVTSILPVTPMGLALSPDTGGATMTAKPTITGFLGNASPGATVNIFLNGVQAGTVTAVQDGTFTYVFTTPLNVGQNRITASTTVCTENSNQSTALVVVYSIPVPAGLALSPDTGGATTIPDPTITGTGVPGETVNIYLNGAQVGSATVGDDGSFTYKFTTPLNSGQNSITAEAVDSAGNKSAQSTPLQVTYSPPVPSALALSPNTGGTTTKADPTITGTASPGAIVNIYLGGVKVGSVTTGNDGVFTYHFTTPLIPGENSITATEVDSAGNESAASTALLVNYSVSIPTGLALSPDTSGVTTMAEPTITGTATLGTIVNIYLSGVKVGSVTTGDDGIFTYKFTTPLTPGENTITATEVDGARNESAPSTPLLVNYSVPVPSGLVLSPDTGSATTIAMPTIIGSTIPGRTVNIYLDGVQIGTATAREDGSFTYKFTTPLIPGENSITTTVIDSAGNESAPSAPLLVDYSVPVPSGLELSPDTGGSTTIAKPTITGNTVPGGTVNIYLDGVKVGTANAAEDGKFAYVFTEPLAIGANSITATNVVGGNESLPSTTLVVNYSLVATTTTFMTSTSSIGSTIRTTTTGSPTGTTTGSQGSTSSSSMISGNSTSARTTSSGVPSTTPSSSGGNGLGTGHQSYGAGTGYTSPHHYPVTTHVYHANSTRPSGFYTKTGYGGEEGGGGSSYTSSAISVTKIHTVSYSNPAETKSSSGHEITEIVPPHTTVSPVIAGPTVLKPSILYYNSTRPAYHSVSVSFARDSKTSATPPAPTSISKSSPIAPLSSPPVPVATTPAIAATGTAVASTTPTSYVPYTVTGGASKINGAMIWSGMGILLAAII